MNNNVVIYSLLIFMAALFGGGISIIKRWSDEFLHFFISFGAGVFLGVMFFHILPESISHHDNQFLPIMVLAGYLFIFFIERILFSSGQKGYDHNHKVISITVLVGLSVHSIIEGIGLSLETVDHQLGRLFFISIITHKIPAAFALTSLMVLGKFSRTRIFQFLILFALMTPSGTMAFAPIISNAGETIIELLTAFTAGTFLYIATADILPEVFHTKEKMWIKFLLLILGIITISFLGLMDFHPEGH